MGWKSWQVERVLLLNFPPYNFRRTGGDIIGRIVNKGLKTSLLYLHSLIQGDEEIREVQFKITVWLRDGKDAVKEFFIIANFWYKMTTWSSKRRAFTIHIMQVPTFKRRGVVWNMIRDLPLFSQHSLTLTLYLSTQNLWRIKKEHLRRPFCSRPPCY